MYSDAEAFVVIAYFHDTYRFRSTIGQAFQVETSLRFLLRNEFCCDGQLSGDYLVYGLFQLLYFFFRGAGGKTGSRPAIYCSKASVVARPFPQDSKKL